MADWRPDISNSDKPRYLAIADAIADDIAAGRLVVGDRLLPQRKLAKRLDMDFTTIARGYVEAQKRGLIQSKVGQGTFVRDKPRPRRAVQVPPRPVDLSMNLPPEPDDPGIDCSDAGGRGLCDARYCWTAALSGFRRHPSG